MALKFKEGVEVRGLRAEALLAMAVAVDVVKEQEGKDCIVTSMRDGIHTRGSVHSEGLAFDMRSYHLSNPQKVASALKARLPNAYDVVVERDHIHVELDPRRN